MPTLRDHQGLRLTTLSALYFAQGVPWGFISVGYAVLLADLGLGAAELGKAMGLAYLPWSFKILWGPLLDAVPPLKIGRRRPFILFAELMMGLTLLGLFFVDPVSSLGTVSLLLFAHNTFAALQDVAVDAMAVDILTEEERGRANALMWAGKSFGVVVGGSGGLLLAQELGWGALFLAMTVTMWLIALFPLLLPERPVQPDDQPVDRRLLKLGIFFGPFVLVGAVMYGLTVLEAQLGDHWAAPLVSVAQPFAAVGGALLGWPLVDREGFRELRDSFSFPTPWWALLAGVLAPAGYAMVGPAMSKLIRADLGLSEGQISTLAFVDAFAGVVGALLGGWLADRIGVRRAIGAAMGAISGLLLLWALTQSHWPLFAWIIGWTLLFQGAVNAYNAGTLGLYMGVSNPRIGATHFSVYMAATNLTYAWTAPVGGLVADHYGFQTLFVVAAVVQVVTIVLLVPIDPARAAARFAQAR
jgi:PAT family beta-lactamase induction signal transducer AmpG